MHKSKLQTSKVLNGTLKLCPTQKAIKDLQYFAGILGAFDPLFTVKTVDGDLKFFIGDRSTDRVEFPLQVM